MRKVEADIVKLRGACMIGIVSSGWGAELAIDSRVLTLESLGKLSFSEYEVVSLSLYQSIPLFSTLVVEHNRTELPRNIRFWYIGSQNKLSRAIGISGFHPSGLPVSLDASFPMAWLGAILFIVLAGLIRQLIQTMGWEPAFEPRFLGANTLSAALSALLCATLVLGSSRARSVVFGSGETPVAVLRTVQVFAALIVLGCLGEQFL